MNQRSHAVLIMVAGFVLLASLTSAAKQAPDPAAEAARIRARTRALVVGEGRPAFVMTATLSVKASETNAWLPGSYELRWIDPRNWKEEIHLGDASAVVRVREGKRRDRRSADPTLAGLDRIRRLMLSPAVRPILAPMHAPGRVKAKDGATCFSEELLALDINTCVDDATGALQRWHLGTELYEFDAPEPFHGVSVPRTRQLMVGGDPLAKAHGVRIVEPGAAEALAEAFVDGDVEAACVEADRPQFVRDALPQDHLLRMLGTLSSEPALVTFVVAADGRLEDIAVKRSTGSAEGDRTALRWVKASLYAPATCDGRPVSQSVEVVSSSQRRP